MGRQVRFYMVEDDEREFMSFANSDDDVGVLLYTMPSSIVTPLKMLPRREVLGWFIVWLWNREISPRPKLDYVERQGYYVVDELRSEVIEFVRSYVSEGRLIRGRIWAQMKYWDLDRNPPELVKKGEWFPRWFNRLGAWIKRKGVKDRFGAYVLPGAASFAAGGGQLCAVNLDPDVKFIYHEVDRGHL